MHSALPYLDRPIPSPANNLVSDEIHIINFISMSRQVHLHLQTPDLERPIFAGANNHPRIRTPGQSMDSTNVSSKSSDESTRPFQIRTLLSHAARPGAGDR